MKIFNYISYRENYHFSVNFYSVFLLVTFIPDLIGIQPTLITLPFWGLRLLLGIWIIVKEPRSFKSMNPNEIIFIMLVIIYTGNLYIDIFLTPRIDLEFSPSFSEGARDFIVFCVNIIIAFSFRYHPAYHSNKSFHFFIISLTIGLIIAFFVAQKRVLSLTTYDIIRYAANSTLNSIVYGQTAAALSLVSFWGFLKVKLWRYKIILVLLFLFGIVSIVKTGSRAPIVVLVLITAFYFIARYGEFKGTIIYGIIIFTIYLFINPIVELLESMNSSFFTRLTNMIVDQDSSGRDVIYTNVLEIILQNPIFGSYYLVPSGKALGGYPHNFILEVLMTAGLLGGIPFLFLLFTSLIKSYRILKMNHSSGWIILLYLQIVVFGMFSTSLFSSLGFWTLLFYVSSVSLPRIKVERFFSVLQNLNEKKMENIQ